MHRTDWIVASVVGSALSVSAAAQCGSACADKTQETARASLVAFNQAPDIVDTAIAAGSFKTLAAALGAAELVGALKGEGPFTVFAPTDEAFAKLPAGTVENLLKPENKELLKSILLFHVVSGDVRSDAASKLTSATTLSGQRLDIKSSRWGLTVDGAKVTTADVAASNGVIHVIDTVMMPVTKNIAQVAGEAGSFSTLLAAAKAADLVPALTGTDQYTVFAPTDEAFAKLPAGTVETLLKPENQEQLKAVLLYHIVPGRVYADQVLGLIEENKGTATAATVQGQKISARLVDGGVTINNANVVSADIEASNGVIHVIDTVLLPE